MQFLIINYDYDVDDSGEDYDNHKDGDNIDDYNDQAKMIMMVIIILMSKKMLVTMLEKCWERQFEEEINNGLMVKMKLVQM